MGVSYRVEVEGENPELFEFLAVARSYAEGCAAGGKAARVIGPGVDEAFAPRAEPPRVEPEPPTTQYRVEVEGEEPQWYDLLAVASAYAWECVEDGKTARVVGPGVDKTFALPAEPLRVEPPPLPYAVEVEGDGSELFASYNAAASYAVKCAQDGCRGRIVGPDVDRAFGPLDVPEPPGRKDDAGKPRFGLVPPDALLEIVKVLTAGAEKYGDENWRRVEPKSRYVDAALRHINAYQRGEVADPETGLPHLAHAACCLMFLLEAPK